MTAPDLPAGVGALTVTTARGREHLLVAGPARGTPIVLLHGNVSSSRFFDETLAALPAGLRALAPDLRGFGDSEPRPIDATRGLRDFSDDLDALLSAPALRDTLPPGAPVHLVGWSAGGGVAMQYAIDHPARVASLILLCPMSPFGFGGTRDVAGTPTCPDFAGSGGGGANPEFVRRLAAGDTSEENDFSPRRVMNGFYFKPPFRLDRAREDRYVEAMLKMRVGPDFYPGDMTPSPNWPTIAPGRRGINNTFAPAWCNLSGFAAVEPRPDVLWIRGDSDTIVSDTSLFDFGYLGQLGAVPGWPGPEAWPPQPMIAQTRAVFDAYRARGGRVREVVLEGVAHSPHLEAPDTFLRLLGEHLAAQR